MKKGQYKFIIYHHFDFKLEINLLTSKPSFFFDDGLIFGESCWLENPSF